MYQWLLMETLPLLAYLTRIDQASANISLEQKIRGYEHKGKSKSIVMLCSLGSDYA